jgi:hypothetical protein
MSDQSFSSTQVLDSLKSFGMLLVSISASVSLIAGAMFYVFEPRVLDWLDERDSKLVIQLESNTDALTALSESVSNLSAEPRISFRGRGTILNKSNLFKPGDLIEVFYQVNVRHICNSTMRHQFINTTNLAIVPFLTTLAPAGLETEGDDEQIIAVRIPLETPAGRYMFLPTSIPDPTLCPNARSMNFPVSDIFTVTEATDIGEW